MKITILDKFTYYTIPKTDNMIDIPIEDLHLIGKTKCFDVENNCVIDYDNTENIKSELRIIRESKLHPAFDKWEKAVLRGREVDDANIMNWFYQIQDLIPSAFIESNIPERIKFYFNIGDKK